MRQYKRLLVAVDLAGESKFVLEKAKNLAGDAAQVSAVHILEPAYFYYGMEPAMGTFPDNFEQDLLQGAKKQMAEACKDYGISPEHQYLERGHAATQILKLAEDRNVDLIVIGSHGRHGWKLILGSTANAVLHGAKCDVLAVRIPE